MSGITYEIDDKNIVEQIKNDAQNAAKELVEKAHLSTGAIVVVGCSTSSTLGLDIGGTLIGMHLKEVAVPVHMQQSHIGKAILLAARTRPKFIGGERAHYDENLKEGYPRF